MHSIVFIHKYLLAQVYVLTDVYFIFCRTTHKMKHTNIEFVFELLAHKSRFRLQIFRNKTMYEISARKFLTIHIFLINTVEKFYLKKRHCFKNEKLSKLSELIITLGPVDR